MSHGDCAIYITLWDVVVSKVMDTVIVGIYVLCSVCVWVCIDMRDI